MKQSLLTITKSAMKFFFDIDPVLTEHMIIQVTTHTLLVHGEVTCIFRWNVQQGKNRIIQLLRQEEASQQLKAA